MGEDTDWNLYLTNGKEDIEVIKGFAPNPNDFVIVSKEEDEGGGPSRKCIFFPFTARGK